MSQLDTYYSNYSPPVISSPKWSSLLKEEFQKQYFKQLTRTIEIDAKKNNIFPKKEDTFKIFDLCDYDKVRVVILGQDPYHNHGRATGVSFAVPSSIKRKPQSLKNIMKEVGLPDYDSSLLGWVDQGVFLLNTSLTVRERQPGSHSKYGWSKFTDEVLRILNNRDEPIVFLFWGNHARSKRDLINTEKHVVLETSHPSPFSVRQGFFGCDHFNKANNLLTVWGFDKIDWKRTGK